MKFHADQPLNNSIEAIGEGWVRIAGQQHANSLLLSHTGRVQNWAVTHAQDLQAKDLEALDTEGIELVLLGTGQGHRAIHPKHSYPLVNRGVGLEVMSSPAACRTYNVLIGEGRRVLLALIQEPQG